MINEIETYSNIESEILVSVFCLAYNHEKYIKTALDGFIKQKTSFKYEVIVHDDASTDNTAEIIREYQKKYPDIIKPIFQSENQYSKHVGIMSTFMLPAARGKYIAFCEGDDYWCDENKLQIQVDCLEKNSSYVASVHNTEFIHMSTGKKEIPYPNKDRIMSVDDCVTRGSRTYQTSSLVVRKDIYANPPKFAISIEGVGDYPRSIYYSLCGPIYYFGRVMSVYRLGTEGSWTNRINSDPTKYINILDSTIKMLKMADDYSENKYHELFSEAIERHEYYISIAKNDFKKVVKSKKFFSEEKITKRIRYYIYSVFPFVRTIVKR